uniref:G-protein coupled receptors family 3 profile domain-containing protein n=1 Tax=Sphenodon punctatus TaxID=8508 RepID=A0A8D0HK83_SPHPU
MASMKWYTLLGFLAFSLDNTLVVRGEEEIGTCRLLGKFDLHGYVEAEEDMVVVGGLFPIHFRTILEEDPTNTPPTSPKCEGFNFRSFRWLKAMILAINEINKRKDILPDISLGYQIFDTCYSISKTVEVSLAYLTGQNETTPNFRCSSGAPLAAVVGAGGSSLSITSSRILGLYYFPEVGYASSSSVLSDKYQFPTYLRTMASDVQQSKGIANLIQHFGWLWVGTIAADDDYGKYGVKTLKEAIEKRKQGSKTCIAFSETLPKIYSREKMQDVVKTIKNNTANVILVYASDIDVSPFMAEVAISNITGKTWIASEAWITSALITKPEYFSFLGGTIGFAVHRGDIPGLKDFLLDIHPSRDPSDDLTIEFWQTAFNCTWRNSSVPYNTDHRKNVTGQEDGLMYYMKHLDFTIFNGERVNVDTNGDVYVPYDLINWQMNENGEISLVKVGVHDESESGHEFFVDNASIFWNNPARQPPRSVCSENCKPGTRKGIQQGKPACCFICLNCADGEISNQTDSRECFKCDDEYWSNTPRNECVPKPVEFLAYEEALGTTLIALSIFGSFIVLAVTIVYVMHRDTALVKSNDRELSFLIQFSLVITLLSSILFVGRPEDWSCQARQMTLALGFSLCLSCVLGKTIVLLQTYMAKKSKNAEKGCIISMRSLYQKIVVLISVIIQLGICTSYLILLPPYMFKNIEFQATKVIIECNEGSIEFLCVMFGFDVLLAILCFITAFIARKLPDNFNEAKFITFGMLAFFIVWISFVPAYLSTKGKFKVAVEIFAILASSLGLLGCIFVPKCYIILLKPERNTEEILGGRAATNDKSAPPTSASCTTDNVTHPSTISTVVLDD